jgi:hypothetical protein
MSDAYALARLRVVGFLSPPGTAADWGALRAAANRAGRRLVDVVVAEGGPGIALGWQDGDEPAVLDEPLSEIYRQPTATIQLVLAACLRCCWPDPDQPLYPGEATTETGVLQALDSLSPRTPSAGYEGASSGVHRHRKSALRVLRACGFLTPDSGDGAVKLGPAIAQWTPTDVAELRRGHHLLPSLEMEPT